MEILGYYTLHYGYRHFNQAGDPVTTSVCASKHRLLLPNGSAELARWKKLVTFYFFPSSVLAIKHTDILLCL